MKLHPTAAPVVGSKGMPRTASDARRAPYSEDSGTVSTAPALAPAGVDCCFLLLYSFIQVMPLLMH